jgi:hypothetical protein
MLDEVDVGILSFIIISTDIVLGSHGSVMVVSLNYPQTMCTRYNIM